MSEFAWKMSPKFEKRKTRKMLSSVPDGFLQFLQTKIRPVTSSDDQQIDIMVRRTLALWRLCWSNVPNAWSLIDSRLKQTLGDDWQKQFENRNGKVIKV